MHLDIVFPAHDEEARIGRTLSRYRHALDGDRTRFIVALDGCEDGTEAIVRRHRRADPRVSAIPLPKLGKGGALSEALRRCEAPVVAFTDADGATPPSELLRLAEVAADGTADVAIASRRLAASVTPARRTIGRRITSAGFARGVRQLFGVRYADTQCGAKALTADAAHRITPLLSSRDFLFDVDLLVTAERLGFTVDEVPTVWIDQDGSKVDAVHDARRMATSALRLWIHHRVLPVEPGPAASTGSEDQVIDLVDHLVREHGDSTDEGLVGA